MVCWTHYDEKILIVYELPKDLLQIVMKVFPTHLYTTTKYFLCWLNTNLLYVLLVYWNVFFYVMIYYRRCFSFMGFLLVFVCPINVIYDFLDIYFGWIERRLYILNYFFWIYHCRLDITKNMVQFYCDLSISRPGIYFLIIRLISYFVLVAVVQ